MYIDWCFSLVNAFFTSSLCCQERIWHIELSPGEDLLAICTDKSTFVYDTANTINCQGRVPPPRSEGVVDAVDFCWSADGHRFALVCKDSSSQEQGVAQLFSIRDSGIENICTVKDVTAGNFGGL